MRLWISYERGMNCKIMMVLILIYYFECPWGHVARVYFKRGAPMCKSSSSSWSLAVQGTITMYLHFVDTMKQWECILISTSYVLLIYYNFNFYHSIKIKWWLLNDNNFIRRCILLDCHVMISRGIIDDPSSPCAWQWMIYFNLNIICFILGFQILKYKLKLKYLDYRN